MDSKSNFTNIFNIGIKKTAEFDADLESVEKESRKFTQRKLEGWELLQTGLKGEKVHMFYTCVLITFLYEPFYTVFNEFEIGIKFCVFWYPYQNIVKKYLWGYISTFTNFEF